MAVRNFFDSPQTMRGEALAQELRMTEPMVRHSAHRELHVHPIETGLGYIWDRKMVLEQAVRRHRGLGRV